MIPEKIFAIIDQEGTIRHVGKRHVPSSALQHDCSCITYSLSAEADALARELKSLAYGVNAWVSMFQCLVREGYEKEQLLMLQRHAQHASVLLRGGKI